MKKNTISLWRKILFLYEEKYYFFMKKYTISLWRKILFLYDFVEMAKFLAYNASAKLPIGSSLRKLCFREKKLQDISVRGLRIENVCGSYNFCKIWVIVQNYTQIWYID